MGKSTLSEMNVEEKIEYFSIYFSLKENNFTENSFTNEEIIIDKFHIGGARYQGGTAEKVQGLLNSLQKHSKIPLLVLYKLRLKEEMDVVLMVHVASGSHCEASGDLQVSYDAGYVSGVEETALGVNVNFDPCVDILFNWRNTIVNTRAYGNDADTVIKHTNSYIKGLRQSEVILY